MRETGKLVTLEGIEYRIGLPYGGKSETEAWNSEWDYLTERLEYALKRVPSGGSWTESMDMEPHEKVVRGVDNIQSFGQTGSDNRLKMVGFRPMLTPVSDAQKIEFGQVEPGCIRFMFSLLMDGKPVHIRDLKKDPGDFLCVTDYAVDSVLKFSDEYYGDEYLIPWVFWGGRAMSVVNLLARISWNDLYKQGFI